MSEYYSGVGESRRAGLEEVRMLELARERIEQLEERVGQLQTALESRIMIEQAKGILAERLSVGMEEASAILRYAARSRQVELHDVAGRVVHERETPAPVIVAMARSQRARAAWMRDIAEAHRARVEELHVALHEQLQLLQRVRDGGQ